MSTPLNPESTAVQSYLNILQGVITRMATNSANCKTWCITLTAALLVFIGTWRISSQKLAVESIGTVSVHGGRFEIFGQGVHINAALFPHLATSPSKFQQLQIRILTAW